MTTDSPWLIGSWMSVVQQPNLVDELLGQEDEYAGVALLALTLNHHDPDVVLPRIKRGLGSMRAQTRANALQSLGHHARLHGSIDVESLARLRLALRHRTVLGGYEIRGYAANAASDVGMFVSRAGLPRWLRRRFAGPRHPVRASARAQVNPS
ncbi:hypothetical protein KBX06_27160 [Micromonospora sp. C31]|uniref:hypothetical protein n=1 Tax=Micromonospora sp. C31 TaxID=2824876 RepID=UPI001B37E1D4|nr:hypothetical protein [Micromonospora sp. C31]MBQ1076799.1 hypothetical protein [Micromonospora sp. C31]